MDLMKHASLGLVFRPPIMQLQFLSTEEAQSTLMPVFYLEHDNDRGICLKEYPVVSQVSKAIEAKKGVPLN